MKKFIVIMLSIITIIFAGCYNRVSIERLSVITGMGFDVKEDGNGVENTAEYLIFRGNNIIDRGTIQEEGETINDANNDRQLNLKKDYLLGTIRAYVISEERAKLGIKDIIDTCVRDQERNLNTIIVVCKGKCKQLFDLEPNETHTMADEIKELIDSSYSANFFTNNATIKDLINMYYQEGRNIVIPVVEKKNNAVKIHGIAVFDKDKLKNIIPIEEARYINLLRNNNVKGSIAIVMDNYNQAVDVNCISKRKVSVNEENNRLKYKIKLNIRGEIKLKTLDIDEQDEAKIAKEIEKMVIQHLNEHIDKTIDKAKSDYAIDVFDIQKYAVAKLGRENEEKIRQQFSDSDIEVEMKVKIVSTGRYKK